MNPDDVEFSRSYLYVNCLLITPSSRNFLWRVLSITLLVSTARLGCRITFVGVISLQRTKIILYSRPCAWISRSKVRTSFSSTRDIFVYLMSSLVFIIAGMILHGSVSNNGDTFRNSEFGTMGEGLGDTIVVRLGVF